ncbi:hypothetical protein ACFO8O_12485 [Hephaestia sp. GCM10023244]|uniref:hypothetical protein n=1 Tax=unclassified Hephaestia TaxID=2631281 RepID=UPI0020772718|nr:hypothetical protein [Hephaestia sp. MAHUQ-44]MCM8731778.1 hypothetical protein [Hephaestia sp. MAHUQ-44]
MRNMLALAAVAILAGCIPASPPPVAPAPQPAPAPAPVPSPPPVAPAPAGDWHDWPLTPGDWRYRQDAHGSVATFGTGGADVAFALHCDRPAQQIIVSRVGIAPTSGAMMIRTSSTARALASQPSGATMVSTLAARDSLIDAMGYSRGRFIVEQPGLPILVIPAYAEIERVAEDCR